MAAADCPFELPAAAYDVSYCQSRWGSLAHEFSIDDAGAADWAAGLDLYLVQPITESFEIKRFGGLHSSLHPAREATITAGWQTSGYVDGRKVLIAYDKDQQRAYYFTESR